MAAVYTITPELRIRLKEPFGMLIKGSFEETMLNLKELIKIENPSKLISVGDTVSKNMHEFKFKVDLSITDNLCMRKKFQSIKYVANPIYVKNPPGTITQESLDVIKKALKNHKPSHIIIEGEEDLLTLIAVIYAPQGSFVVYGQPYEGIVLARATPERKTEASQFLKAMQNGSKS